MQTMGWRRSMEKPNKGEKLVGKFPARICQIMSSAEKISEEKIVWRTFKLRIHSILFSLNFFRLLYFMILILLTMINYLWRFKVKCGNGWKENSFSFSRRFSLSRNFPNENFLQKRKSCMKEARLEKTIVELFSACSLFLWETW